MIKKIIINILQNNLLFLVRVVSLGIDTYVLYLCVDKLHLGNLLSKIIANAGTTFINYFVGKLLIFKKD